MSERIKEFISKLREYAHSCAGDFYNGGNPNAFDDFEESAVSGFESLVQWHDVTKELPPDEDQVLVYCDSGNTYVDWIDKDTGQFMHRMTKAQIEEVTTKFGRSQSTDPYYRALEHGSFITHWRQQVPGIDSP